MLEVQILPLETRVSWGINNTSSGGGVFSSGYPGFEEGMPVLKSKFHQNLLTRFPPAKAEEILNASKSQQSLASVPVHKFMGMLAQ